MCVREDKNKAITLTIRIMAPVLFCSTFLAAKKCERRQDTAKEVRSAEGGKHSIFIESCTKDIVRITSHPESHSLLPEGRLSILLSWQWEGRFLR